MADRQELDPHFLKCTELLWASRNLKKGDKPPLQTMLEQAIFEETGVRKDYSKIFQKHLPEVPSNRVPKRSPCVIRRPVNTGTHNDPSNIIQKHSQINQPSRDKSKCSNPLVVIISKPSETHPYLQNLNNLQKHFIQDKTVSNNKILNAPLRFEAEDKNYLNSYQDHPPEVSKMYNSELSTSTYKDNAGLNNTYLNNFWPNMEIVNGYGNGTPKGLSRDLQVNLPQDSPYFHQPTAFSHIANNSTWFSKNTINSKGVNQPHTSSLMSNPNNENLASNNYLNNGNNEPSKKSDTQMRSFNDVLCIVCKEFSMKYKNHLVKCRNCHNLYHQKCHKPTIQYIPKNWFCLNCKEYKEPLENSRVKRSYSKMQKTTIHSRQLP